MGMKMEGVRLTENGVEWKLPCLLYADDLVLCGESEESLSKLVEGFGKICKRRGLKVNVDKSKVMVIGKERGCRVEFCWMVSNWSKFQSLNT